MELGSGPWGTCFMSTPLGLRGWWRYWRKRELKAMLLLQGEMEQALENYDVCTEMLQHSAVLEADSDSNKRVVIRLPNLHVDSVVSLEEVMSPGCLFGHLVGSEPCLSSPFCSWSCHKGLIWSLCTCTWVGILRFGRSWLYLIFIWYLALSDIKSITSVLEEMLDSNAVFMLLDLRNDDSSF